MTTRGHGSIVNVASIAAFMPGPYMSVYYATKAFVLSFSEALSEELAETGVHVTALCPGPTESGFKKSAGIGRGSLFRGELPTSEQVAEYGYAQMMKGKRVAVHGIEHKFYVQLMRFMPRALVSRLVKKAQS